MSSAPEEQLLRLRDDIVERRLVPVGGLAEERLERIGVRLADPDVCHWYMREAGLPPGWIFLVGRRPLTVEILDELNRCRATVVVSSSSWGWPAELDVTEVHGYVVRCVREGRAPVTDQAWATPSAVRTSLVRLCEEAKQRVEYYAGALPILMERTVPENKAAFLDWVLDERAALPGKLAWLEGLLATVEQEPPRPLPPWLAWLRTRLGL